MSSGPDTCLLYSRSERLSDAVIHLAALTAAVAAVPVLIVMAALWQAGPVGLTGIAIYGGSLIAMILCSYLYNHLRDPVWTPLLRRLDHGAIYIKIAGTYTPFALLSGAGLGLLAMIWAGALTGIAMTVLRRTQSILPGVTLCLAMGWAVLIWGGDLVSGLSTPVLVLMVAGGVIYSVGVPFLLACHIRFHNAIWHGFVMVASVVFFVAVFLHLAEAAPRL
jgi:hemolysin III